MCYYSDDLYKNWSCFFSRTAVITGVSQHGWPTTSTIPSIHRPVSPVYPEGMSLTHLMHTHLYSVCWLPGCYRIQMVLSTLSAGCQNVTECRWIFPQSLMTFNVLSHDTSHLLVCLQTMGNSK